MREPVPESRRWPMLSLPQSCSEPDGSTAEVLLVAELAFHMASRTTPQVNEF
jgi:hypothetical protein